MNMALAVALLKDIIENTHERLCFKSLKYFIDLNVLFDFTCKFKNKKRRKDSDSWPDIYEDAI